MANETKNVFISHVHEDDAGLGALKDLLARNGLDIRDSSITSDKPNEAQDPEYIKREILAPRIKWASTLIVYITPDTKDSAWVNWEIEYAEKMGKRIVGVWAHGASEADLPEALDQYADAVVGWNSDRIVDAVNGQTQEWRTSTGELRSERPITRYSCG
jgi:hypothetical protein